MVIDLHRVRVDLGGRAVLRDVTLALPAGAACAVVGPNGCGKSTLARLLAGFVFPTTGRATVAGRTLGACDVHGLRRAVQLVQRDGRPPRDELMTVRDVIATGRFGTVGLYEVPTAADLEATERAADTMDVAALLARRFDTLSAGEASRALVARALAAEPDVLLLDEPAAGLDLPGREDLLARLAALPAGLTKVHVAHHLEELPAATTHALLLGAGGRVVAFGAAREVLTDELISEAMGRAIRVFDVGGRRVAFASCERGD